MGVRPLILPPRITPGDAVAVVAPAGPIDEGHLDVGVRQLSRRYRPVIRGDILTRRGYFAGDAHRRLAELQGALDDETVRGIISARGGFGITDIIDRLDFSAFTASPKWIVGSSDITALLIHLFTSHRCLSIHGPMAAGFHRTESSDVETLFSLLEGRGSPLPCLTGLSDGVARGPFIGGNLTILAHLAGTPNLERADGAVLFLEDVGEHPYRLDRCLVQLRRAGLLDHLAGVVIGELTACPHGSDGVTPFDAVARHLVPLGIPVAYNYPAAHGPRNAPFIHGKDVDLEVSGRTATLTYSS